MFPASMGRALGIEAKSGRPEAVRCSNGQVMQIHIHTMRLAFVFGQIDVFVFDQADFEVGFFSEDRLAVIGRAGILDRYRLIFDDRPGPGFDIELLSSPVLEISELKILKPDGRAKKSLAQIEVSLTVKPAVFTWTNVAGQPEPSPKVTYSVHNGSRSDLNLTFPTTAQVRFVVRDARTKQELWKHPEVAGDVVTHLKIDPGKTFSETIDLPREAAANPGNYIMEVSFCGDDQFDLTTRFEVAIS